MIVAYIQKKKNILEPYEIGIENQALLKEAIWIDLLCPTKAEEDFVESNLELYIPTREEMREIEFSSRLYKENDVLFMTATMLAQSNTDQPKYDAVTFILA